MLKGCPNTLTKEVIRIDYEVITDKTGYFLRLVPKKKKRVEYLASIWFHEGPNGFTCADLSL